MNRTAPENTKLTICVWHPFTEWRPPISLADAIRKRWPAMRVVHLPDYDRLPQELPGTDIFVGYSLRAKQLADAKKLKWIHSTAAGVAQLMYPELRDSGILVTNPSGIFSVPMAEHTMGLLIALARNFPDSVRYQDQSRWAQQELWDQPQHLTELNGQVLLIVGFGSIGNELARRAKAFGMRVWGVSRSGKGDAALAEKIVPITQLHEVLPHADFVVISAPETRETAHLVGAPELARMKPTARLINVARSIRAARRSPTEKNRRRRARRSRPRTSTRRRPALESPQPAHHSAHQRHQRPSLAAANHFADGFIATLVRRPRPLQSSRSPPRLLVTRSGTPDAIMNL
jgi:hypothetical protein